MFGIDLWSNIYESIFEEILLGINLSVKQAFESSLSSNFRIIDL
jgi:hypothetical protein